MTGSERNSMGIIMSVSPGILIAVIAKLAPEEHGAESQSRTGLEALLDFGLSNPTCRS